MFDMTRVTLLLQGLWYSHLGVGVGGEAAGPTPISKTVALMNVKLCRVLESSNRGVLEILKLFT